MTMQWRGVMPAMTTCLKEDLTIDHEFVAKHCQWLLDKGCTGIVSPGSLGEGNTLTFDERVQLWKTLVRAAGDRAPVVAAISALSTAEAIAMARAAKDAGCRGLMVLPPYVYKGDWREMKYHVAKCFQATELSSCSTTIPSPMALTSCQNRLPNWPLSIPISNPSKNPARMCGA